MYKKQNRDKQKDIRVVSLEDLVPRDHLLRKIDRAINFDFIYEEVKDLYSATEWGKPGIDPVFLFKIVLIQHLYGIRSMRQTLKEIEVNYVANTACDRHNFVLGFVLGAGNIHDSQMLSGVYQNRKYPFCQQAERNAEQAFLFALKPRRAIRFEHRSGLGAATD